MSDQTPPADESATTEANWFLGDYDGTLVRWKQDGQGNPLGGSQMATADGWVTYLVPYWEVSEIDEAEAQSLLDEAGFEIGSTDEATGEQIDGEEVADEA